MTNAAPMPGGPIAASPIAAVPIPVALTIAGSDSSGGAGIQADLKTFTALGVYGATAIVALTAQNTRGVAGVHPVPPAFVAAQIDRVAEDLAVDAVKTGMLATSEIVRTVAEAIARHRLRPLVVDPVMVATSGDVLLDPDAMAAVRALLLPGAALVTPNLAEAAALLDGAVATSVAEMAAQGRAIVDRFKPLAVLVKGGHGFGAHAIDVLVTAEGVQEFALPRLAILDAHGTGCTLSAAITAHLAQNLPLAEAVDRAKAYLWHALAAALAAPRIGHGARPVDHAHAIRRRG